MIRYAVAPISEGTLTQDVWNINDNLELFVTEDDAYGHLDDIQTSEYDFEVFEVEITVEFL